MKYRITKPFSSFNGGSPPNGIESIFPLFNGEPCSVSESEVLVTFPSETTVSTVPGIIVQKWNDATESWEAVS